MKNQGKQYCPCVDEMCGPPPPTTGHPRSTIRNGFRLSQEPETRYAIFGCISAYRIESSSPIFVVIGHPLEQLRTKTDHAIFYQGLDGGCLSGVITVCSRQRGVVTLRFTSLPVISCKLVPYLSTSRVGLPTPKLLEAKLIACRSLYCLLPMCQSLRKDFTNSRLEGGRVIAKFLANQLSAEAKADVQAR